MLYGIKSCWQGKLIPFGESDDTNAIEVDKCNTFNIERTSDTLEFRADGVPAITAESNVKLTFKLGMEVFKSKAVLAMILGGTYDKEGDKITVSKDAPAKFYSYEGIFTMYTDEGEGKVVEKATLYKAKPQANASIDFSSIDISTFEVTFDCFPNPTTGEFYNIAKNA